VRESPGRKVDGAGGLGRKAVGLAEGATMTTKEELRRIVDILSEEHAVELLEYAHWLEQEDETLTDEEIARATHGEEQLRRGERVSWEELRRQLSV
jgi:hypothetical protein